MRLGEGRLRDRNVKNRPDTMVNIRHPPNWYLKRFYYDTCVYDPMTLDALVAKGRRPDSSRLGLSGG